MIKRITQIFVFCLLNLTAFAGNVTFTVDMSCYTGSFGSGVYVSGSWDGWSCANCWLLTDNGDGTWSGTFDLPDGDHEFKFQISEWADQEMLVEGSPCTTTNFGFTNRTITVSDGAVYNAGWNSCDGSCIDLAPPVDVTFTVDMSCYPGDPGDLAMGVFLNGSFNGWCGTCNPMSDNGDGTWSLTIPLPAGDIEFKYTIGDWTFQDTFVGGEDCTLTTGAFTNRILTIPAGGTTISAAWNSCATSCATIEQPGDITFCVCAAGAPAGSVYINGSFNDWCGDCNPLENVSGDLWCVTLPLSGGGIHYKFTIDGWTAQEEFVGGENCVASVDGNHNRMIVVDGNSALRVVDWNACTETSDPACLIALPMELTSFDVTKDGSDAQIEWTTESDDSDDLFVVEYSRDAINFEEIGTVQGTNARGINNYNFKHYLLANGANYYRLKNIDVNETIQYSDVRNLDVVATTKISVNPTVSNSNINIQVDESQLEGVLHIYNVLGDKVLELNITDTNFSVDISGYATGQYMVVIQNGEEQSAERFIKTF